MSNLSNALNDLKTEADDIDNQITLIQSRITILRARKETLRDAGITLQSVIDSLSTNDDFTAPTPGSAVDLNADVDDDKVMEFETSPDLDDTQEIN